MEAKQNLPSAMYFVPNPKFLRTTHAAGGKPPKNKEIFGDQNAL